MKKVFLLLLLSCFTGILSAQTVGLQWVKQLGGNDYDAGKAIAVDASGNVYTTGAFSGTADFDPGLGVYNLTSAGENDIFLSKLDASGNFQWAIRIGGPLFDWGQALSIDGSGNIYLTGYIGSLEDFNLAPTGTLSMSELDFFNVFITKINSDGQIQWSDDLTGQSTQVSTSLALDWDGNVYISGNFRGETDFDPGAGTFLMTANVDTFDIFVLKLTGSGNFVWTKQFGGPDFDFGSALAVDMLGSVYMTGSFSGTADFDPGPGVSSLTSAGNNDAFVLRLNASGDLLWVKQFSGPQTVAASSIALDASNNIVTSGYFAGQVDFNPDNAIVYLTSAGSYDIYISKIDQNGNFMWITQMGGVGTDASYSLEIDLDGNIYTTGTFSDVADFNPDPITSNNITSYGDYDIFLSKLDANGSFISANQMGGSDFNSAYSLCVDATKNIYLTGQLLGTSDMDPEQSGIFMISSIGASSDIFVSKLSQFTVGLHEMVNASFAVYPNPSTSTFTLSALQPFHDAVIKVINPAGQTICEQSEIKGMHYTVDLSALKSGMYFLLVTDGQETSRTRIIKN